MRCFVCSSSLRRWAASASSSCAARTHARTHTVCTRAHQESAKSRRLALLRRQSGATTISGAMSHERRFEATAAALLRLDRRCGFSAYLLQRLLRRKLLSVELCALGAQLGLEVLWAMPQTLAASQTAARHWPGPARLYLQRAHCAALRARCRSCARTRQRSAAT
jgi:hypothetical protein